MQKKRCNFSFGTKEFSAIQDILPFFTGLPESCLLSQEQQLVHTIKLFPQPRVFFGEFLHRCSEFLYRI